MKFSSQYPVLWQHFKHFHGSFPWMNLTEFSKFNESWHNLKMVWLLGVLRF